MDFPTAWAIARRVGPEYHHNRCSFNVTNGGLLCDCDVLTKSPEYVAEYGRAERLDAPLFVWKSKRRDGSWAWACECGWIGVGLFSQRAALRESLAHLATHQIDPKDGGAEW